MLKIRLQRVGKKNSPSYRVVLVEHTAPPRGKFQEILGSYSSQKKEKNFKKDRIEYWISKGVQLSPTIHNLLVNEGILKKPKVKAWKPKKRKEEGKTPEVKPAAAIEKPAEVAGVEAPKIEEVKPIEESKPIDNTQQ